MIECNEALNSILEEEIVETINHRLLTCLLQNYLDIDHLNNSWHVYARSATDIKCSENETEIGVALELAMDEAPPRPPKPPLHPADIVSQNQSTISQRSLRYNDVLTEFTSNSDNFKSKPFGRTPENESERPALPPRAMLGAPVSEHTDSDAIWSKSTQNIRKSTQTARGKPTMSNSSPSQLARRFLSKIVPPPSQLPVAPAKDYLHHALVGGAMDTADIYMDQNEHIYDTINFTSSTNKTSDHFGTNADTENPRFKPMREHVAPAPNSHEINARLVSQELMLTLQAKRNLRDSSRLSKPTSIAEETEDSDDIFQDYSSRHEPRKEESQGKPVPTKRVTRVETPYESPDEFNFPKINGNTVKSPTKSQNAFQVLVEGAIYDTPEIVNDTPENEYNTAENVYDTVENVYDTAENVYDTAENVYDNATDSTLCSVVGKKPNYTLVKTLNASADNDDTTESYYDPVTCWDTASTASDPCSWLADEPLYQHTEAYKHLQRKDPSVANNDSVGPNTRRVSKELEQIHARKVNGRTLWCRVGSVTEANVLGGMSSREKNQQEAKFEIYTTEFSFLKSLKLLKRHFIMSSEFCNEKILSKSDRGELFMYVKPLMARSKAFLRDLDDCWRRSIYMHGIFDVICKHASKNFDIYITYCSYLNDTIEKLNALSSGKHFLIALKGLELSEDCSKLSLLSFLTLPMERITSIDLLIKKALSLLVKEDKTLETRKYDTDYDRCLLASDYVKKVCEESNEACRIKRRIKRLIQLDTLLSYPAHISPLSLISEKRWLVMYGDVSKHDWLPGDNSKIPNALVRSISSVGTVIKSNYTIFLFNDYVVLAKRRKSDGSSYTVSDYCRRQHAKIVLPSTLQTNRSVMDASKQYKMLLVINENHEKKKAEWMLSCALKQERDRWVATILEEIKKPVRLEDTPKSYVCIYPFTSEEEKHLSLVKGDEVTVIKKLGYGWLEGIRSRDKKKGIFPPSRVKAAQPTQKPAFETYYQLYTI